MKFTREQVIEMAREAGIKRDEHLILSACITHLCTLAADAALEAAAVECEKYDSLRIDGAGETIRDLKDKP